HGRSGVRNGVRLRRMSRESTGLVSIFPASCATYARTRSVRTRTESARFANRFACRARASASEIFGTASVLGLTLKTRCPCFSSSGDAKYFWICTVASLGRRLPTGTPPTVTPSGSTRGTGFGGGFRVVVVVGVVVVAAVVVAAVVVAGVVGVVDVVAVVAV